MNRFRKLGFIEYNGGSKVSNSLLSVVLDQVAFVAPVVRRVRSTSPGASAEAQLASPPAGEEGE